MKFYYLSALICTGFVSYGQNLPTVKAIGGDGTKIDWVAREKAEDKDGPGYFYSDCAQGTRPLKASSTLTGQGTKNYALKNLADDDPKTAWVEGVAGYGTGEWFEVGGMVNVIYNGYQSSPIAWANNSRVKTFKVYENNSPICLLVLTDEMGQQSFELPVTAENRDSVILKFEIVDVYKGLKWDDVAISHIDNVLCCLSFATAIGVSVESTESISEVMVSDEIMCINLENNTLYSSNVELTATQEHVGMIKICTETKSLILTKDHPVNFKGYGFISVNALMSKLKCTDLQLLVNNVEVLTWDAASHTTKYEKLAAIETLEGKYKTYSIRKISGGAYYIANGIVTETY
ncbi:MAG: hypothetical protein M3R17_14850 [Bacteroidota bacterium]|nr:hypothetical protein [Bacteroidota bacterium]